LTDSHSIKVQILSSYESSGGAARAANRLHKALVNQGVDSRMRVRTKSSDDWRVDGPKNPVYRLKSDIKSILEALPPLLQKTSNPILHSPGWISGVKAAEINNSGADVVNLHWVCDGLISIANIGRITRPVVWTLHDSWPFCGMEHHPLNAEDTRFEQGYTAANRPAYLKGLDLDRWTWKRKLNHFKRPMHLVSPSRWLAQVASRSMIARNWPVTVIPNPLDTNVFRPLDQRFSRELLNLPQDKRIILVGAFGSVMNRNKGFDLLSESLHHLVQNEVMDTSNVLLVVFGQTKPQTPVDVPIPVHFMGHLNDDYSLSLLYNAADLVVVPSRMENLPQTATEAQACGIPVVAFNVCGIPDAVSHMQTGYLASAYETLDLAQGMAWVLENEIRYAAMKQQARRMAESLWAPEMVTEQYLNVYQNAIEQYKK
jgi:glycosyltransferase involved in cell wall biosynthesis